MPRRLISNAPEWINDIPTVPIYYLAKPLPRDWDWKNETTQRSTQNWHGLGESDCLIKTKHCHGRSGCRRNVITAQCSECQSEEIQASAGKRRK